MSIKKNNTYFQENDGKIYYYDENGVRKEIPASAFSDLQEQIDSLGKPLTYSGDISVTEANELTEIKQGTVYTVTGVSGTLTAGDVEVKEGDEIAWADPKWVEIGKDIANSWKQWSEDNGSSGNENSIYIGKNISAENAIVYGNNISAKCNSIGYNLYNPKISFRIDDYVYGGQGYNIDYDVIGTPYKQTPESTEYWWVISLCFKIDNQKFYYGGPHTEDQTKGIILSYNDNVPYHNSIWAVIDYNNAQGKIIYDTVMGGTPYDIDQYHKIIKVYKIREDKNIDDIRNLYNQILIEVTEHSTVYNMDAIVIGSNNDISANKFDSIVVGEGNKLTNSGEYDKKVNILGNSNTANRRYNNW